MNDIEILYDHYKDSNVILREAQRQREMYLQGLFILEAFNFVFLLNSSLAISVISGVLGSYGVKIDSIASLIYVVQIMMWVLISYFLISYFQKNIYIERQYGYIYDLEQEIVKFTKFKCFSREGDDYTEKYPVFLNLVDRFYKIIIPVLFIVMHTVKIISEITGVNTGGCLVVIVRIVLYLWTILLISTYLHKMCNSLS